MARERDELSVVADQIGAPTWSQDYRDVDVRACCRRFSFEIENDWMRDSGVYHLTASGATSWCGFAQAIFDNSKQEKKPVIKAIPTASYPTPAARPVNSRLSNHKLLATFGVQAPEWREALRLCMAETALIRDSRFNR